MASDPLTRPIAPQRTVKKLVKRYAELMGFHAPWRIIVNFVDSRKDEHCVDDDHAVYACCEVQPQYYRAVLSFALYHPSWHVKDETIDECIRHELGHAFVSLYTQSAVNLLGDKDEKTRKIFEDLEDQMVQRLASMPVWAYAEDE